MHFFCDEIFSKWVVSAQSSNSNDFRFTLWKCVSFDKHNRFGKYSKISVITFKLYLLATHLSCCLIVWKFWINKMDGKEPEMKIITIFILVFRLSLIFRRSKLSIRINDLVHDMCFFWKRDHLSQTSLVSLNQNQRLDFF